MIESSLNFTLNTGAPIPAVAYGTFGAVDEETYTAISNALKAGYRHIDTAYYYQNEKAIGRAIRDSGVPREDIFITTKLWPTQVGDPAKALKDSLNALRTDYIDLYLLHWAYAALPDPGNKFSWGLKVDETLSPAQIWHRFQNLPKDKARALGVCNYNKDQIIQILESPDTLLVPAVNQVELHPELPQTELVEFCQSKGILVEAYCPLANGQVGNPIFASIAARLGVDPGQVILSWNVQRGVVVLPKSVKPSRIQSNRNLLKLDEKAVQEIAKLGANKRRIVNPNFPGSDRKIFSD